MISRFVNSFKDIVTLDHNITLDTQSFYACYVIYIYHLHRSYQSKRVRVSRAKYTDAS